METPVQDRNNPKSHGISPAWPTSTRSTSSSSTITTPISILRTGSPWYSGSAASRSNTLSNLSRKTVRIVSPIRWGSTTKKSVDRKRAFINSTVSFLKIKSILRDIGCDPSGGYEECVDKLLDSDWVPPREYIESNDSIRAKPIHPDEDRMVELKNSRSDYLSSFTMNDLRKWLKQNGIKQKKGQNKQQLIALIRRNFYVQTPVHDVLRVRRRPNKPTVSGNKSMCKTPRHKTQTKKPQSSCKTIKEAMSYDADAGDDGDEEAVDGTDGVRMHLCFDFDQLVLG